MIVTLTGPTAAGKSTLERELQKLGFGRAISHTTRQARAGEICGEHYHFINDATFDAMNGRDDFIETVTLGTRRYALSKQSLQAASEKGHVVIVVEPHGAAQIRAYCETNGLPITAFWIDCGAREQAGRWIARTYGELNADPYALEAAIERLTLMLTEEVGWRANIAPHQYHAFLLRTRQPADLAEEVVQFVQQREAQLAT